jgi:phage N-6-adenine-methyltransferase
VDEAKRETPCQIMSPSNAKTGVGSGSGDWRTPPELFKVLQDRFRFDYDGFADHDNALLPTYSTLEGTFRKHDCGPQQIDTLDGLHAEWLNRRVFLNPPYSRGDIGPIVASAHARARDASLVVALLSAATDTKWFHDHIVDVADVTFLRRRVRFINPDTRVPGTSPPGGSMIVVWHKELQP